MRVHDVECICPLRLFVLHAESEAFGKRHHEHADEAFIIGELWTLNLIFWEIGNSWMNATGINLVPMSSSLSTRSLSLRLAFEYLSHGLFI